MDWVDLGTVDGCEVALNEQLRRVSVVTHGGDFDVEALGKVLAAVGYRLTAYDRWFDGEGDGEVVASVEWNGDGRMTEPEWTFEVSYVRPSDQGVLGWDADLEVNVGGSVARGEVTLKADEQTGKPVTWGMPDHWATPVLAVLFHDGPGMNLISGIEEAVARMVERDGILPAASPIEY